MKSEPSQTAGNAPERELRTRIALKYGSSKGVLLSVQEVKTLYGLLSPIVPVTSDVALAHSAYLSRVAASSQEAATPLNDKAQRIADYFGVPVAFEAEPAPSPATKETPKAKETINMTFVDDKVREHFPSYNYGPHVRAAAELLALECFNGGKRAVIPRVEEVSALVHEQWMKSKRTKGVLSRKSESGEELMVPYAELSEAAKDLDRGSVKAVLDAMIDLGVR